MTPLELVLGARVKKITVSVSEGKPNYTVLVKFSNGSEHRLSVRVYHYARKLAKKVGLAYRSKAEKAAVQVLKEHIDASVAAFQADPETAAKIQKAVAKAIVNAARAADRREMERIMQVKDRLLKDMISIRISLEDLTELWNKSVVVEVLTS